MPIKRSKPKIKKVKESKRSEIEKDVEKFGIDEAYQEYKKSLSWKKGKVKIHDLAWKVYSDYLLLTKCVNGCCTCVTCGAKKWWSDWNMHPWHFLEAGKSLKYKFNDDNVHPQCAYCNVMLHGNYKEYTIYMVDNFSRERVDSILSDKWTVTIKNYQYADMINTRRDVVKKLMKKYPKKEIQ